MPLKPGTLLGPYEVLSLLGAGGMGEVYKGRDTRLDRLVALKVLAPHLAGNPEARARFEREARTVANLKHPNICVLYDIGHESGVHFLVLEYLEGETLAERLKKGSLPLEQVLQYAIEISDALDKAHHAGATHRDVKPGNIMLVPQSGSGPKISSKLLDFGLAKLKQEVLPNLPRSEWPTGLGAPTVRGTVLGTPQYMAPEQVEGKVDELDARTDIFSFGATVYEMVTGKKAFEGKSPASVAAAILALDPPPMSALQPLTPPALDHTVRKCLAKDPDNRWQTARDVWHELEWIKEQSSQASVATASTAAKGFRTLGRRALLIGLGCLLLIAAAASLATWTLKPAPLTPPHPVSRFTITLPPGQRLAGMENGAAVALSPDGNRLVYAAIGSATQQLYLRALDGLEAKPIPGTEGGETPFFSPDGQWIGFFANGRLKKVSVNGGAPVDVGATLLARGASWGGGGTIVLGLAGISNLRQVSEAGGTQQALTLLKQGEAAHYWPEFLPGGKAVLFAASPDFNDWTGARISVQSLQTGERRDLNQGGTHPRYAPSGHLVFAQGGNLMAAPFDPQRLALTGAPAPVVEGVLQSISIGSAQYSFSATGSLVYVPGGIQATRGSLVWVSRNGAEQPLVVPVQSYFGPRLSPDGKRVAAAISGQGGQQIWLYDLSRETLTRLTFEGQNQLPAWTPDEKRIVFQSSRAGPLNLFWQLADGSGGLERLATSENTQGGPSWSPEGQFLAFHEISPTTGRDLWVLRMSDPSAGSGQVPRQAGAEGRKAQPFLQTPFDEAAPQFSPDGHWLAYMSDESGRTEVYVQPYPGPGGKWQISTGGGAEPMWNHNGREIFYRNGNRLMAVEVATQPGFVMGKPKMLFEGPYLPPPFPVANYDVSPDGQRFLMVKPSGDEQPATQINVVLNWFEELKRRVPAGR